MNKKDLDQFGFLKMNIPPEVNLIEEINRIRKEKNIVILAHFYQKSEIQDIADHVGDSLFLAQAAESTKADIILFSGVHFMAETAKILNPDKKVLLPDLKAGCSLADSCNPSEFKKFMEQHADHSVISYINTTAEIKMMTDIICTSSNALQIIETLPKDEKIIFAPDRNLGNYINSRTGRNMLVWDGACHVHEDFSLEKIVELKTENPEAKIIAHPECEQPVLLVADHIGSTASLLKFTQYDPGHTYIVATEAGILHQMRKLSPEKLFIPAPPNDSTCACNDCNFMKLNTMEKIYNAMVYEQPELIMDPETIKKAVTPIKRMLEISAKLGL